ncbi:hypothetical protein JMJ77_0010799 [Colletotrichum scovillei]|uniref:Uncharacterized protein n=1 Tax=Colletotrichum scovillei TaxID=1209932 RepID=A0A9P7R0Q5_9PEZI|nr:hypothetical protein JMJ77_0010799 [Colletotrichum scovillei]KAG7059766.1 hypothetical protein JMJ78_0015055 [Colletotrichum scovillei]KAG7067212.1 hypothetical protein JMJ76_0008655 [Colletotrichum scovillei]
MTGIRHVSPALDGFHGRQPKVKRKERRAKSKEAQGVRNKSESTVTVTDKQAPHPPPG